MCSLMQFQTKRAALSSMDVLVSIMLILAFSIPALNYCAYSLELSSVRAKNMQTLSTLLQEASLAYNFAAAKSSPSQTTYSPFTFAGVFDSANFAGIQANSSARRLVLGLDSLSYSLSAPNSIPPSQICVSRTMSNDYGGQVIFVCGN